MTHFIVTFRIASDTTYQERYDSFVDQVIKVAGGNAGKVWDETTSFYAFTAASTAETVAASLNSNSKFDTTKDLLVVIDLDNRVKATRGKVPYESLLTSYIGF